MILIPTKETESLTVSELREKLQKREIGLCHKRNLSIDDTEYILENMVYQIGPPVSMAPKKTLQVLKVGRNMDGYPAVQVSIASESQKQHHSTMATRIVCEYCEHKTTCPCSPWEETSS